MDIVVAAAANHLIVDVIAGAISAEVAWPLADRTRNDLELPLNRAVTQDLDELTTAVVNQLTDRPILNDSAAKSAPCAYRQAEDPMSGPAVDLAVRPTTDADFHRTRAPVILRS